MLRQKPISASELIKEFTPLSLVAEKQGNQYSIGYNRTFNVHNGLIITKTKAEQFLLEDIELIHRNLYKTIPFLDLRSNEDAAIVSFIHSIGIYAFRFTKLPKALQEKDRLVVSNILLRESNGNRPLKRRQKERNIYLGMGY